MIAKYTLPELQKMLAEPSYSFEVSERPLSVGGGWKLTLYEGKEEMGGGVFEASDSGYSSAYEEGFSWQYQRFSMP